MALPSPRGAFLSAAHAPRANTGSSPGMALGDSDLALPHPEGAVLLVWPAQGSPVHQRGGLPSPLGTGLLCVRARDWIGRNRTQSLPRKTLLPFCHWGGIQTSWLPAILALSSQTPRTRIEPKCPGSQPPAPTHQPLLPSQSWPGTQVAWHLLPPPSSNSPEPSFLPDLRVEPRCPRWGMGKGTGCFGYVGEENLPYSLSAG